VLELDLAEREVERLRAALESIVARHDSEDSGEGFTRGGGMAWAMADDARKALGLPVKQRQEGSEQ
jgi:hypothetical protein